MTLTAPVQTWVDVCPLEVIVPGRGVCALVAGHQVAIFRVPGRNELFAVSNYDPFSRAFVLSRGILGTKGDRLKVSSPVYKQSFDLRTGECLDNPAIAIPTFAVRVERGRVEVASP